MRLWELQEEIAEWAGRNFPTDTRETVVLGLAEETGELCRAALKGYQGIRGTSEEWEKEAYKEIGDVFLKLAHVCCVWGFDLENVIRDRWNVIRQRDFVTDPIGHGLPETETETRN
jgi:NTP pyrophosphatase (non-canonical NTP hydrolase)